MTLYETKPKTKPASNQPNKQISKPSKDEHVVHGQYFVGHMQELVFDNPGSLK